MYKRQKLLKAKRTITLDHKLNAKLTEYIKKRAPEIIKTSGRIPSESEIIEELLRKGLDQVRKKARTRR